MDEIDETKEELPEIGEIYFYVHSYGVYRSKVNHLESIDQANFESGNFFKTEEEVISYIEDVRRFDVNRLKNQMGTARKALDHLVDAYGDPYMAKYEELDGTAAKELILSELEKLDNLREVIKKLIVLSDYYSAFGGTTYKTRLMQAFHLIEKDLERSSYANSESCKTST